MTDKISYIHGDSGTQPPDGHHFTNDDEANDGEEEPQAPHFNWFWDTAVAKINAIIDSINAIDSDGDGVVDEADYANDADASTYKGNDLDSDGDGIVDNADKATTAETLTNYGTEEIRPSISEGGTEVEPSPTDVNVTGSGANVSSDGDGSVTVDVPGATDTHVTVEDDGAIVLSNPDALNAGANLSISADGDGSVTISADDDASTYKGNDIDSNGDGVVDEADNADHLDGADKATVETDTRQQTSPLFIEERTSQPSRSSPSIYIRTDE